MVRIGSILALALLLGGCSSTLGTGAGAGSVVGGFTGNPLRPGGTPAESVLAKMAGGLVGTAKDAELSDSDRLKALEAEYRALEYTPGGQAVPWQNPATGRAGEVTAAQPYRVGSQDCRQYTHVIDPAGARRSVRGTACRNADGSWTPLT